MCANRLYFSAWPEAETSKQCVEGGTSKIPTPAAGLPAAPIEKCHNTGTPQAPNELSRCNVNILLPAPKSSCNLSRWRSLMLQSAGAHSIQPRRLVGEGQNITELTVSAFRQTHKKALPGGVPRQGLQWRQFYFVTRRPGKCCLWHLLDCSQTGSHRQLRSHSTVTWWHYRSASRVADHCCGLQHCNAWNTMQIHEDASCMV